MEMWNKNEIFGRVHSLSILFHHDDDDDDDDDDRDGDGDGDDGDGDDGVSHLVAPFSP